MLTRYTRDGLVRDLLDGKHVGIVGPRLDMARTAFLAVLDELPDDLLGRILTSTGRERLELTTGGRLSVHAARPDALRGYSLDVVVIVRHRDLLNLDRVRQSARPALLARDGELILA